MGQRIIKTFWGVLSSCLHRHCWASGVILALPYKTVNAFLSPGLTHTTQTLGQHWGYFWPEQGCYWFNTRRFLSRTFSPADHFDKKKIVVLFLL